MTERPILMSDALVRGILAGKKTQTRRLVKPRRPPPGGVDLASMTMVPAKDGMPVFWDPPPTTDAERAAMRDQYEHGWPCPFGGPGDRLYVREAWSKMGLGVYPCPRAWYRADFSEHDDPRARESTHEHGCNGNRADCWACEKERNGPFQWTPSIHMPRWASRLTLDVTGVRVERAQEISDADVAAEGIDAEAVGALFKAASKARQGEVMANDYTEKSLAWSNWRDAWTLLYGRESWEASPWCWVISFRRTP